MHVEGSIWDGFNETTPVVVRVVSAVMDWAVFIQQFNDMHSISLDGPSI